MIAPCPGIKRGTDATVPMPPGLVRVMVAPCSSSAVSALPRARSMSRSYSVRKASNERCPASRITGTTRNRAPSLRVLSTASPRCGPPGTRAGLPSAVRAKCAVISGFSTAAFATAYPIRCVNDTFAEAPAAENAVLSSRRRASRTSTAMVRNDVAVGMSRLRSMCSTSAAAGPRITSGVSPSATCGVPSAPWRSMP